MGKAPIADPPGLLRLDHLHDAGLSVGHFGAGRFAVWSERDKRLVQALDVDGGEFATMTADDGRGTLVVYPPDFTDSIIEDLHGKAPRLQFLSAYDLISGALRWRRREPMRPGPESGVALGRSVVRFGMLFDASTGVLVKTRPDKLVAYPRSRRRRWPLPPLDPVEFPGRVGRRASAEDLPQDKLRRAFHFGPDAKPPSWPDHELTPEIGLILRRLGELERRPRSVTGHAETLPFPADVRALYAAQSPWLRKRWAIDPARIGALSAEARDRGAPRSVTVFGRLDDGTLLCAQPTALGCRIGLFNNGYAGPFPVTTALSHALWALVESQPALDADERCRSMQGWLAWPGPEAT